MTKPPFFFSLESMFVFVNGLEMLQIENLCCFIFQLDYSEVRHNGNALLPYSQKTLPRENLTNPRV